MSERIRVVLADDHSIFRSGLKALLSMESDLEVVGEAAD
ncbi:MAG TPA: DNA-binding response regulator, partial [Chloroflexota bacterium]